MKKFLLARKKELRLFKMLLRIKAGIKKLKGEDFSLNEGLIEFVEAAIQECELLLNSTSAYPQFRGYYMKRFDKKGLIIVDLFEDLKKETN
ncbi:unnamed protein product, partial [Larinioides sclopetarius]